MITKADTVSTLANWFFRRAGVNLAYKSQQVINFHFLWWVLGRRYPLWRAAHLLRMSSPSLVLICRSYGITWPYRQFKMFSVMYSSGLATSADKALIRRLILTSMRHRFIFPVAFYQKIVRARQKVYRHLQKPVKLQRLHYENLLVESLSSSEAASETSSSASCYPMVSKYLNPHD